MLEQKQESACVLATPELCSDNLVESTNAFFRLAGIR